MSPILPLILLACGAPAGDPLVAAPPVIEVDPPAVALEPMFAGREFERPLDARQAPGDARTWYVVEQRGAIWAVQPDGEAEEVLDIAERVDRGHNEEGLLGLAFAPDFERSRAFYVNYSVDPGQKSRLSRFFLGRDGAAMSREEILLEVPQPWGNHNGGGLAFGPDGYLYFSLGDGGAAGDPNDNGQDKETLLGSILRLDVSGDRYRVPDDNPFGNEVWAYGLRNAWRFAFDRETGELWAGDVGQNTWEWISIVEKGGNHGWNLLEGFHAFDLDPGDPLPDDLVPPVYAYPRGDGISVTGGFVYRGSAIPELDGAYVFADYVTSWVWTLRRRDDGAVEKSTLLKVGSPVASFAEGHDGELLVIGHHGPIWRLVPGSRR